MNLAEVQVVTRREIRSVQSVGLTGQNRLFYAAVEVAVGNRYLNVGAFEVDRDLVGVRGNGVLVVAVICPCDNAALANTDYSWTEAECAAAWKGEVGRVEVSEINDADARLVGGCVDWNREKQCC